jgi:hypothetical protein
VKLLSNDELKRTRGGGTVPNSNASIVALVAATWPGPDSVFAPPPGSIALFAELNGVTVAEVVAILNSL